MLRQRASKVAGRGPRAAERVDAVLLLTPARTAASRSAIIGPVRMCRSVERWFARRHGLNRMRQRGIEAAAGGSSTGVLKRAWRPALADLDRQLSGFRPLQSCGWPPAPGAAPPWLGSRWRLRGIGSLALGIPARSRHLDSAGAGDPGGGTPPCSSSMEEQAAESGFHMRSKSGLRSQEERRVIT